MSEAPGALVSPDAAAGAAEPASVAPPALVRVLLVEDNVDQAELTRRTLRRADSAFEVTVVGDGLACLTAMGAADYDVVLLDYSLPRMTGLEVLGRMRERGLAVPVVMVTGQGDERVAVEAMKAGAMDYVIKTGGYLTTLSTVIRKVLKQQGLALENARLFERTRALSRDLAWARDRLEAILRSLGEAIIVTDTDDRLALLNPVAEAWLGMREQAVAGLPLISCFPDPDFAREWSEWWQEEGDVSKRELILQTPRPRTLAATRSLVKDEQGLALGRVTVLRDITRERELDRMKDEFISNVSHELRTPMASIKGFTATIQRDRNMTEETRNRFLQIIREESERLTALIEDLLDLSRMTSGKFRLSLRRMSLREAVERTLAVMDPLFQDKGVALDSRLDPGAFEILGDVDRICQIVTNLLSNALKFTPEGGRVEVSLKREGALARLGVADTGIGIAPERLARIFERFYRVPGSEQGGTGLGLTIVHDLVERHQGRIEVESEVGRGSRFVVTLLSPEIREEERNEDPGR